MFAGSRRVAFEGIEARAVDVLIQIGPGVPAFTIVGLPDKAVAESRERVRGALNAIGLGLPPKRIRQSRSRRSPQGRKSLRPYDLPIALGLMAAVGAVARDAIEGYCVLGELALDGSITTVAGALPADRGQRARQGPDLSSFVRRRSRVGCSRHGDPRAIGPASAHQFTSRGFRPCAGPFPRLSPR